MSNSPGAARVLRRKCGNRGDDFEFVECDTFQAFTVGGRFTNGAIVKAMKTLDHGQISRKYRQSIYIVQGMSIV